MIALWTACASGVPTPPPGRDGAPPIAPPLGETSDTGAPLVPTLVTWSASFGWDEGPVAVGTPYGVEAPEIVVVLGGEAWAAEGFDASHAELSCEIAFPLVERGPAAWTADDPRLWHGLDAGPASRSTCPAEVLSGASWGVAVGELSPSAEAFADYQFGSALRGSIFGGRVLAGEVVPADDEVWGRAWAIDDAGDLQVDASGASTPLDADLLFATGALARGWYRLQSMYIWPLEP